MHRSSLCFVSLGYQVLVIGFWFLVLGAGCFGGGGVKESFESINKVAGGG